MKRLTDEEIKAMETLERLIILNENTRRAGYFMLGFFSAMLIAALISDLFN